MKKIKQTLHYKKLKNIIPEKELIEMIEEDIMPYLDMLEVWKEKAYIPEVFLCDIFPKELELHTISLSNFLGKWGNLSVEAVSKICLIVKHFKPKHIFEIGTFNGRTASQLALNSDPNCKIYTLDLPADYKGHGMSRIDTYMFQKLYDGQVRHYHGRYWQNRIEQLIGDSRTFDFSPYYGKIDLMLIDGAHDYDTKKSDTENALKMLSPNGILIWDNYDDIGCPFVTQYLSQLNESDFKLYHLKNTNLVVYKNENSCS
jgi:predicted O-methyltransferase YrrM